ncbi:MAG TPA: hypothetical protein VMC79_04705 [Rectinemataceae bacterium]|nr:hypothetical protein [Rectinemataceae bacterium]
MRFRSAALGVVALALGAYAWAQSVAQVERSVQCLALVQASASSEGQSLFLQQMGFGPEALRAFAPSRFERGPGGFRSHTEGAFGYQMEGQREIARSGEVILYQASVRVRSAPPPRAKKTVTVDLSLSELAKTGDAVQPDLRAIEVAATRLGWTSGLAWIIDMSWRGLDTIRVRVALAP